MTKGGQVLRALSPKRKGSIGHKAEASGTSTTARAGSRTLFARHKRRHSELQQLPDTEKTDEEFQRDWGITKEEEVGGGSRAEQCALRSSCRRVCSLATCNLPGSLCCCAVRATWQQAAALPSPR